MKKSKIQFDGNTEKIYYRKNAIKADIIIFSVIGIWIGAMCKLFSLILPLDGLLFWKYLLFALLVLCFLPFTFLTLKNIIILIILKKKR